MFVIPLWMRIQTFLDSKAEWECKRVALIEAQIDEWAAAQKLKLVQEGPNAMFIKDPLRKKRKAR